VPGAAARRAGKDGQGEHEGRIARFLFKLWSPIRFLTERLALPAGCSLSWGFGADGSVPVTGDGAVCGELKIRTTISVEDRINRDQRRHLPCRFGPPRDASRYRR